MTFYVIYITYLLVTLMSSVVRYSGHYNLILRTIQYYIPKLLYSIGIQQVCYAAKQEKPFWFSLLGQMVQFDAIIFCRTFKYYFGQFVWLEKKKKKRVTIIVAFHFMKRRLKTL